MSAFFRWLAVTLAVFVVVAAGAGAVIYFCHMVVRA